MARLYKRKRKKLKKCYCFIKISAVKRFKYLIAINRIYVIVNSKLIAINRKFLSILNVRPFVYLFFPSFYFYFNALINIEKWIGLLYANVFFKLKTNSAKQGGTK